MNFTVARDCTTTFSFVRLRASLSRKYHIELIYTLYIAHSSIQCNETKCKIPPKTFEIHFCCCFCSTCFARAAHHTISFGIRCLVFALGFPFHEHNNFQAFAHGAFAMWCRLSSIYSYFLLFFPFFGFSVRLLVMFEASYLVSAATMLLWKLWCTVWSYSRRRHFVAKYTLDMRNI